MMKRKNDKSGDNFKKSRNGKNNDVKKLKRDTEISELPKKYSTIKADKIAKFTDFPLSQNTLEGLTDAKFIYPTKIQRESIGYTLQGRDVLVSAKTGSGKTLAFVIPVLERLYMDAWYPENGPAVLILTPTRELAQQIFDVFNKVGRHHYNSVGFICGGKDKDVEYEKNVIHTCNILICTPGRLLHHMDQNPNFDCSQIKMFIIDEADYILQNSFVESVDAIIQNLPKDRQTMLYSATQTRDVDHLARLSLTKPLLISAHELAEFSTPNSLKQFYVPCKLCHKANFLWSFLQFFHGKKKVIVFVSTKKQVAFLSEALRLLQPHLDIFTYHAHVGSSNRSRLFEEFMKAPTGALLSTDMASRGLDFPNVDVVLQLDCPGDVDSYIHRVGRTARCGMPGESILLLLPSEQDAMLAQLKERKIPIERMMFNKDNLKISRGQLSTIMPQNDSLYKLAIQAFETYLSFVYNQPNKAVFQFNRINTDTFARSLGIMVKADISIKSLGEMEAETLPETPTKRSQGDQNDNLLELLTQKKKETATDPGLAAKLEESRNFEVKLKSTELCEFGNDVEVLTLKPRTTLEGTGLRAELGRTSRKQKRPLTKITIAKRQLRKKQKLNTQIFFEDDGTVKTQFKHNMLWQVDQEYDLGDFSIESARAKLATLRRKDMEQFQQYCVQVYEDRKLQSKKQRQTNEEDDHVELDKAFDDEDQQENNEVRNRLIDELPNPDELYGREDLSSDSDLEDQELQDQEQKLEALEETNKPVPEEEKEGEGDECDDNSDSYVTDEEVGEDRLSYINSLPDPNGLHGDSDIEDEQFDCGKYVVNKKRAELSDNSTDEEGDGHQFSESENSECGRFVVKRKRTALSSDSGSDNDHEVDESAEYGEEEDESGEEEDESGEEEDESVLSGDEEDDSVEDENQSGDSPSDGNDRLMDIIDSLPDPNKYKDSNVKEQKDTPTKFPSVDENQGDNLGLSLQDQETLALALLSRYS